MKQVIAVSVSLLVLAAFVWLAAQVAPAPQSLAEYFPSGPLLYLEAKDFSTLLRDWAGSNEKKLWLASSNYEVFSRSRLFLRLQDAQNEFSQAAGLGADMTLVNAVAGSQSAIAVYSIGNLEFLYITRLQSSSAMATALWQTRTSYEARNSAGKQFFVRTGPNGRVAGFAATDGYLLLATREDLLAGALALLAKQQRPNLPQERWFEQGIKAAGATGELRMLLNMPALVKSPYFRSYWIQRNVSDLKAYSSSVVDFFREDSQWREDRVLLREQASASRSADEAAVARVTAWVPDGTVLYRAWARPAASEIANLIRMKILSPGVYAAGPQRQAPTAMSIDVAAGDESDLDSRIDQPPLPAVDQPVEVAEIQRALERIGVEAAVQIQTSRRGPDGSFAGNETAIGILGASDWSADALRALFPSAATHIAGRALIIASTPETMARVIPRVSSPPAAVQGVYAARFLHGPEQPEFENMMRMIDRSRTRPGMPADNTPAFFSGNVASLGRVLGRVQSESVTVRDDGAGLKQQVVYRLTP